MLSIGAMGAGQVNYYIGLAREDYYTAGGEPPGRYLGGGAAQLGLRGDVNKEELRALFEGQAPDGKQLRQKQTYRGGRKSQPGWDLTFSAPKSVSVLWSQADAQTRQIIAQAHHEAVVAAMDYLEDEATFSRRGKGGATLERAQLIAATFEHGTSRAQDPQLHSHVLVMNAVLRADGSYGALQSRPLYVYKMAAGAFYRAELAHQILSRLDIALIQGATSFEIASIAQELCEEFSTRAREIDAAVATGKTDSPQIRDKLCLSTRAVKSHIARSELFPLWQQIAQSLGYVPPVVQAATQPVHMDIARLRDEVTQGVDELSKRKPLFAERDLVRHVSNKIAPLGISPSFVRSAVRSHLGSHRDIVKLKQPNPLSLAPNYTTKKLLATEKEVKQLADKTKASKDFRVKSKVISAVIKDRPTLTKEQRDALVHITTGYGKVACVSGMAGTGKTFMLDAAREAWTRSGFKVIGCAIAGRAAQQLGNDANMPSMTIHSLLSQVAPSLSKRAIHDANQYARAIQGKPTYYFPKLKISKGTVVVVDEASMVGTSTMRDLVKLTISHGIKLVLVGDERQLQAINDGGGAFDELSNQVGVARMTEIRRQRVEWMRDAVKLIAGGDAKEAMALYAANGSLHVEKTTGIAIDKLVEEWYLNGYSPFVSSIILASTREDVRTLNEKAQATLVANGRIDQRDFITTENGRIHAGERVLFHKNDYKTGIWNGDLGTVEAVKVRPFMKPLLTVRLDRATEDHPKGVVITVKTDASVSLGYAMTTHKAQGATVDNAYILAGTWMQDREMSYVQLSRPRHECHIFSDEAFAGEDLSELVNSMKHSNAKEFVSTTIRKRGESIGDADANTKKRRLSQ